ncbi:hypothetical protein GCM10012282_73150 [Streptomyces lacrimifluminis]|uniref:Uncharacterized protein n=1 Tax=Streptomyces lacrimifluminis TaxID=1500077 RepID=A0A917P7E2_9ACTN|nr:hypothetical protein GCM10012282_73150 [Streptomyces lacrimifluminis]
MATITAARSTVEAPFLVRGGGAGALGAPDKVTGCGSLIRPHAFGPGTSSPSGASLGA